MAITVGSVQTFTDEDLLVLYRAALAAVATGKEYTIGGRNGRTLTREDAKEIRETISWLEQRITNASGGDTGGVALVQFGDRY